MKTIRYVGLDVHKADICIAYASGAEEVRHHGTIANTGASLDMAVRKLVGSGEPLYFVYEAGPGGYGIYRHLTAKGYACMVAAPALIPRKPGDRVKTDKRDAAMLARLCRAGELTAVTVPDADDEAVRDLFRARCDAKQMEKTARQNLLSFLLRIGQAYSGSRHWTKTHWSWLESLSLAYSAQQLALQEYIDTIKQCSARVSRYDQMLHDVSMQWKRYTDVRNLQSLRGVSFLSAVGIVAEVGDLRRFRSAKQLMAYAGLVPSENSSGAKVRRGGITKSGNRHLRWLLVESAWSYRMKARKSVYLLKRQGELSAGAAELSWKAQVRLCGRYQRLLQKGKPKAKVVVSIARELAGFIWALGRLENT